MPQTVTSIINEPDKIKQKRIRGPNTTLLTIISIISYIFILVIWIIGRHTHLKVSEMIENSYNDLQLSTASEISLLIEHEFSTIVSQLKTAREIPYIRDIEPGKCDETLKAVADTLHIRADNLVRTDKNGVYRCAFPGTSVNMDGKRYEYINEIIDYPEHKPAVSRSVISDQQGFPRYHVSVHIPVYDENDNFDGTLGADIYINQIYNKLIESIDLPGEGYIAINDDNGDILYHPDESFIGVNINSEEMQAITRESPKLREMFIEGLAGKTGVKKYRFRGEEKLGAYTSAQIIGNHHWSIILTTPADDIQGQVSSLISRLKYLQAVVSLIIVIFATLSLKSSTKWNKTLKAEVEERTRELEKQALNIKKAENRSQEDIKKLKEINKALVGREIRTKELKEEQKEITDLRTQDLQKFKMAVDDTSDHIVITDPNGIILYANEAVTTITGFSPEEILGKKVGTKDLWGGNMDKSVYTELWDTIKNKKQPFIGDFNNTRKNGENYVAQARVSPVVDHDGILRFFVGIERDITKEKQVDRMKTEFISLVSHQLRTPLSAMKWYLEMMLKGDAGQMSTEQSEMLTHINTSNERMIELVNALLDVSRIESGRIIVEPEPTNIGQLLKEVLDEVKIRAEEKRINIKTHIGSDIPIVNVDPRLTRNVYMNLLTNAIKYTPQDGEVEVIVNKNEDVVVSGISDNGYGIPKHEQEKVFEKFYRGENIVPKEPEGTGLGLYLVKAIIDSSNGDIWFESEEGKGTTFWFTLPLSGMKPKEGEVYLGA